MYDPLACFRRRLFLCVVRVSDTVVVLDGELVMVDRSALRVRSFDDFINRKTRQVQPVAVFFCRRLLLLLSLRRPCSPAVAARCCCGRRPPTLFFCVACLRVAVPRRRRRRKPKSLRRDT